MLKPSLLPMHTNGDDKSSHEEPRDRPPPQPPDLAPEGGGNALYAWLFDPLLYLTISTVTCVYRARGDPQSLAFILFSYLDLIALVFCLRRFERLAPEERAKLKVAVWLLSTALMAAFSYRVSEAMPRGLAALVWLMVGIVAAGGFFGFFLYNDRDDKSG